MAVVLNVDGNSFRNPSISGFGGIFRRNDGGWLYGFVGNIGISTFNTCRVVSYVSWLESNLGKRV